MARKKTKPDECPNCGLTDSDAKFCPDCGFRIGHTGKRGRPAFSEKRFLLFARVPKIVRDNVVALCKREKITQSDFLRCAVEQALEKRTN